VKVRYLSTLVAAAGVAVGSQALAGEPAQLPALAAPASANQKLADTIVNRLAAAGLGASADVTIVAQDGAVTLSGTARDDAQRQQIVQLTKQIAGVKSARDGISVATITPAQGTEIPAPPAFGPVIAAPMVAAPPAGIGGPVVEPVPLGAPGGVAADLAAPPLPPNAWPTYAPYNNVSRVAYPSAYPYNAFPFIGPYYPFPKVPLGWRKVLLEWEDGHWWIGKVQSPQDYWRVRFW
jgi:hypothetical protein